MEQRISLIIFENETYECAERYLVEALTEVLVVFFGEVLTDPQRAGWIQLRISKVLIPDDDDYETRSATFIHMKGEFHEKIRTFADETGLQPLIFDHKQPIDEPSGRDVETMQKTAEYYKNSVLGSYNRFHRFFRLSESVD